MHVKIATWRSQQFVLLVESLRNKARKVRKRTIATLRRREQIKRDLDSVLRGMLQVSDRDPATQDASAVHLESGKA